MRNNNAKQLQSFDVIIQKNVRFHQVRLKKIVSNNNNNNNWVYKSFKFFMAFTSKRWQYKIITTRTYCACIHLIRCSKRMKKKENRNKSTEGRGNIRKTKEKNYWKAVSNKWNFNLSLKVGNWKSSWATFEWKQFSIIMTPLVRSLFQTICGFIYRVRSKWIVSFKSPKSGASKPLECGFETQSWHLCPWASNHYCFVLWMGHYATSHVSSDWWFM